MTTDPPDLLTPRILIVDDERQIHASLRLRLGRDYSLVCHSDPRTALAALGEEQFDLCIVDVHMPHMNGLKFIEAARNVDPDLGFIILSAFDTDENLRRAIPLQVYDFISKPLPERHEFEARMPDWIGQTRHRRREHALATRAGAIASELDSAKLEREVEFVASESARDALLQTANLLTTIHAHLVSATTQLAARAKSDPTATHLLRNLDEARKTADAAMTVAEGFFDSAYGSRDSSPALVVPGIRHAINIATRIGQAESANKAVHFLASDEQTPVRSLSGIDFLLMMVPAIGAALTATQPGTTVGVDVHHIARLETAMRETRWRDCLWLNRRNALISQAGVAIVIAARAPAFSRAQIDAWLKGEYAPLAGITPRGLVNGVRKCRGALGLSLAPEIDHFLILLMLPV